MFSFIDRLRSKPEAVRTRYFFVSVGVSFLFVVVLWAFSLRVSLQALLNNDVTGTFRTGLRDITENTTDSLDALIKSGSALSEEGKVLSEMMKDPPKNEASKPSGEIVEMKPKSELFDGERLVAPDERSITKEPVPGGDEIVTSPPQEILKP